MSESGESHRSLGLHGATGIGVGAIVGGGILAMAGIAFSVAGPAAIVAFGANGVIALLTALSFAEMSSRFPENGGAYNFSRKVLSVQAAFSMGWVLWFASIAASVLYSMGFAVFAQTIIHEIYVISNREMPAFINSRIFVIILAVLPIVFYSMLLTRNRDGSGQWETIGKMILFILLIAGGFLLMMKKDIPALKSSFEPFAPNGIKGILSCMGLTFITLQGFDIISMVSGKVKNPRQNLPKAILRSLGIALLIYIPLLVIIITVGIPAGETTRTFSDKYPETLIGESVRYMFGPIGFWVLMIAAILSMLSALSANMLASSSIALTMARDRTLPRFLSILRNGNPLRIILLNLGICCVMLCFVHDIASAGAAASLIFLISFALTHITCLLARKRVSVEAEDVFRIPLFPLLPILGLVCCLSLALFQGTTQSTSGIIVTTWLLIGFIFYFTRLAPRANVMDARYQAENPMLQQLRGLKPLVLVPIANPNSAGPLIEVANSLVPQRYGRVLLLSIVDENRLRNEEEISAPDVLIKSLKASLNRGVRPEVLFSISNDSMPEILRIAHTHECGSVLLGLGDPESFRESPVEQMIQKLESDVVMVRSQADFELSQIKTILVPVSSYHLNDQLRTRLLNSINRHATIERIEFLRIIPEASNEKYHDRVKEEVMQAAEEESPIVPVVTVIKSNNVQDTICEYIDGVDLIIVGMMRAPGQPALSDFTVQLVKESQKAAILISHYDRG